MMGVEPHPHGLPPDRFCQCVTKYAKTYELNPEILEFMNQDQQEAINEIKKAFKRIRYKYDK